MSHYTIISCSGRTCWAADRAREPCVMLGGVARRHGAVHWIVGLVPALVELGPRCPLVHSIFLLCLLDANTLLFAITECIFNTQNLKSKRQIRDVVTDTEPLKSAD